MSNRKSFRIGRIIFQCIVNMEAKEFMIDFNRAMEKSGVVYVDFDGGFFVADRFSFASFNDKIVFLGLKGSMVGRIDLAKIGGVEEY